MELKNRILMEKLGELTKQVRYTGKFENIGSCDWLLDLEQAIWKTIPIKPLEGDNCPGCGVHVISIETYCPDCGQRLGWE